MASSISRYAERIAPLRALLKAVYRRSSGRKKKSIAAVPLLAVKWVVEHSEAFKDIQEQLLHAVKTARRDPKQTLFLCTDVSDAFWAGVVTECSPAELKKDVNAQQHDPLGFLVRASSGTQQHWSTYMYEREAFAIVASMRKMDYLFVCEESTVIFTDHRNLLSFHPTAIERTLGLHKVLKALRRGLYTPTFTYRIKHVPDKEKVMADILTRWLRGYHGHPQLARRIRESVPTTTNSSSAGGDWPTRNTIIATTAATTDRPPPTATRDEDGLLHLNGMLCLPFNVNEVKLKLLTVAYVGLSDHRELETTGKKQREHFTWTGLRQNVTDFVTSCLFFI